MQKSITYLSLVICVNMLSHHVKAQLPSSVLLGQVNAISPQVPFLLLAHSAGNGGLANIQSVSGNSFPTGMFGNPALLSASTSEFGAELGYMPWLREIHPYNNLMSIGAYKRLNPKHTIGMNTVVLTLTSNIPQSKPIEFSPSISYAYSINNSLAVGIRAKYIYSDLLGSVYRAGNDGNVGQSMAVDFGFSKSFKSSDEKTVHQIGAVAQNIGSKIRYTPNSDREFIPMDLRLGYQISRQLLPDINLMACYEIEKLLVPSPPVYYQDSVDLFGDQVIFAGYDPHVSVPLGIIRSFYDAPDGIKGELHEVIHHFGIGLSYRNLKITAGYFHEHETKGNRKYFVVGAGFAYRFLHVSTNYLLPSSKYSPMGGMFQVSLGMMI